MSDSETNFELITMTAEIVSSFVANNRIASNEVGELIASVHTALAQTSAPVEPDAPAREPAVAIRSSVKHDYIVCLEDGKKLKMLKRYLRTNYEMTPEEYRAKWGLPRDYPMVAPAFAETRRGLAQAIGLGRKKVGVAIDTVKEGAEHAADAVADLVSPKKRGRPPGVKAKAKASVKPKGISAAKKAAQDHLTSTGGDATGE